MTQIFISYSSKDRALIDILAEELDALGYTVWFDRELNRRGGHKWWSDIMEALRNSDIFLYAASPNLIKSAPCRAEYDYAFALGKPIFPAKIADLVIRDLPLEIQDLQIFDARDLRPAAQRRAIRLSIDSNLPAPPLPANASELEPDVPRDPTAVLFDRINKLTVDVDQQRGVIMAIEDLHDDGHPHEDTIDLLQRLIGREDVLTVRNLKRAEELLAKAKLAQRGVSGVTVIQMPPPATVLEPKVGTQWIDPKGVRMVYVPAGKFMMGSDDLSDDEKPVHEITIAHGFWLDLTPVTNVQYSNFVQDDGYLRRELWTEVGWEWLQQNNETTPVEYKKYSSEPTQPRIGVTWFEAYAYTKWRGGRLPTEAEWEWAARGPKSLIYPWGNDFDPNRVIYKENSNGKTATVGMGIRVAGASWVGALDMSGNVWEWVNSLFQTYPYDPNDGRERFENGNSERVLRGGSWISIDANLRAAIHNINSPSKENHHYGFRCARSF